MKNINFKIDFTVVKDELLLLGRPPVDCCYSVGCLLTLPVTWSCLLQEGKKIATTRREERERKDHQ